MKHYILFYKPYGVLSQFKREKNNKALCDFGPFPKNVYPVGRLDKNSEGLLLLTNDNIVKTRLINPKYGHKRIYLVQLEGNPKAEDIQILNKGIIINNYTTKPADVQLLQIIPQLPPSNLQAFINNRNTSWAKITLTEGKKHQVRKMFALIGYPVLRLIRISMEFLSIDGLEPGQYRNLDTSEIKRLYEILLIT